jgi:ferredoxin
MLNDIRTHCGELLRNGQVAGILGIREVRGRQAPHLFTQPGELEQLTVSPKVSLIFTLRPGKTSLLAWFQKTYPGKTIGVVAKGCDERALFELARRNQIDLSPIQIIGYACDSDQATRCSCPTPYPNRNLQFGTRVEGVPRHRLADELDAMTEDQRLTFWKHQFSKCIKCYGCRNACPVCFCKDCLMEQKQFTHMGRLPVQFPSFHFVQRYHHAAQCIECGECEMACPMDIPLRLISKALLAHVKDVYDFTPGMDPAEECPLVTISPDQKEEAIHEIR